MPIWVMGRAYTTLLTEGDVFEGVGVGDVGPQGLKEFGVIPISVVGMECGKLVSGVGIGVEQVGEGHKDSRLYWDRWDG
jgi:hypothetical protein